MLTSCVVHPCYIWPKISIYRSLFLLIVSSSSRRYNSKKWNQEPIPLSSCSCVQEEISEAFHHLLVMEGNSWPGPAERTLYWLYIKEARISQNSTTLKSTAQDSCWGYSPSFHERVLEMHLLASSQRKAPIHPTNQNQRCFGNSCSQGPVSLQCTQKAAAGPTRWAYFRLDHPRSDSQTGSSNSLKPTLNHLPGALPTAPAGSRGVINTPTHPGLPKMLQCPQQRQRPPRSLT